MRMPDFPVEADKVQLRPFEHSDLDALERFVTAPVAQRYMALPVRDGAELRNHLDALLSMRRLTRPGDILAMAVLPLGGTHALGQVSLVWTDATASQAELRFVFAPEGHEAGLDRAALKAALDIAFEELNLHRVLVRTSARHQRTVRLLKQLGLRLEAHFREHALYQGEWDEELHFAILDREWRHADKVRELHRHRVA